MRTYERLFQNETCRDATGWQTRSESTRRYRNMTVDVRKSDIKRWENSPSDADGSSSLRLAVVSLAPPPTRWPAGAERSFSVPLGLIKTPRVCLLSKDDLPVYMAIKYAWPQQNREPKQTAEKRRSGILILLSGGFPRSNSGVKMSV